MKYVYHHSGSGLAWYEIVGGKVTVPPRTEVRTGHVVSMIPPPIFTDIMENPYHTTVYVISPGYYSREMWNCSDLSTRISIGDSTTIRVKAYAFAEEVENLERILADDRIESRVRAYAEDRYEEMRGRAWPGVSPVPELIDITNGSDGG